MPEYGPEGSVLPPPTKGNEVRVATIHRYKGLESPVVVLAEIDERVDEAELASLLYVGATRARSHLVVVCSEALRPSCCNAHGGPFLVAVRELGVLDVIRIRKTVPRPRPPRAAARLECRSRKVRLCHS